jgi:L-alanine-DL-glutamate epimerase-like enolase superfamily enzyme
MRPFIADETICTIANVVECFTFGAGDALNIKPSRVGGITKAAQMRDLAQDLGLKLMVDDPFGGELAVGAIAHLAASTKPEAFLAASHLPASYLTRSSQPWIVGDGIPVGHGSVRIPDRPGLGIEVDPKQLGEPILELRAP